MERGEFDVEKLGNIWRNLWCGKWKV